MDLAFLGDLDAGVEQLREARRIAEAVGKVDEVARSYAVLSGLLESFGELEEATAVALEGADLAVSQGLGRWHGPFLTATAARALFGLGRWDEADRLLHRAAARVAPDLAATRVLIHAAHSQLCRRPGQCRLGRAAPRGGPRGLRRHGHAALVRDAPVHRDGGAGHRGGPPAGRRFRRG